MDGRYATTFARFLSDWRRSTGSATAALSTTDGRWAVVSMSVTLLVAGSIAWLAAGTLPPATSHGFATSADRSLMPYQLFLRLASQARPDGGASYASLAPGAVVDSKPSPQTEQSLDDTLAAENLNSDANSPTPGVDAHAITLDTGVTPVDYSRAYMMINSAQTLLEETEIGAKIGRDAFEAADGYGLAV